LLLLSPELGPLLCAKPCRALGLPEEASAEAGAARRGGAQLCWPGTKAGPGGSLQAASRVGKIWLFACVPGHQDHCRDPSTAERRVCRRGTSAGVQGPRCLAGAAGEGEGPWHGLAGGTLRPPRGSQRSPAPQSLLRLPGFL